SPAAVDAKSGSASTAAKIKPNRADFPGNLFISFAGLICSLSTTFSLFVELGHGVEGQDAELLGLFRNGGLRQKSGRLGSGEFLDRAQLAVDRAGADFGLLDLFAGLLELGLYVREDFAELAELRLHRRENIPYFAGPLLDRQTP